LSSNIAPDVVAELTAAELEIAERVIHMFDYYNIKTSTSPSPPQGSKGSWMELYLKNHVVCNSIIPKEYNDSVWKMYTEETQRSPLDFISIGRLQETVHQHVFPGFEPPGDAPARYSQFYAPQRP
jgi:hypothetical protein